jgi:glutamate/aspartate transport system permease protein
MAGPAMLLAFAIGTLSAMARTSASRALRAAGAAYVEVFRNIPLLVQMFAWYYVLPELLPAPYDRWLQREVPPAVIAAWSIAIYHGVRIGEVLRAAIDGGGVGQRMAADALGIRGLTLYGHVLLPLAYRTSIPPLTSEAMAVVKHTSLALTISVLEITARSRLIEEQTFQGFEAFAAASLFYMTTTMLIAVLAVWVERRLQIRGTLSARGT